MTRLFSAQASHVASGAARMRCALGGGPDLEKAVADVLSFDVAAGRIAETIISSVYATPSAPFDRGSAKDLATALDDAAEEIKRVADIASGGHSLSSTCALADVVVSAADAVAEVMPSLDAAAAHAPRILAACSMMESALRDAETLQHTADLEVGTEQEDGPNGVRTSSQSRHAHDQVVHGLTRSIERFGDVTTILRDIAYDSL